MEDDRLKAELQTAGSWKSRLRSGIRLGCLSLSGLLVWSGCARFQPQPLLPTRAAADFESRSLTGTGLRRFLEANQVTGRWPRRSWDLNALTLVAFYYHPDLPVAHAAWAVAKAGRITAAERPNPSVALVPTYDTTTTPPWIPGVSWDIPIQTAGKRRYRRAVAGFVAEAARWDLVAALWQVRSRLRSQFLALYASRQTVRLLDAQATAQSNVVQLLEGQFQAGSVSDFDVTQARITLDGTRLSLQDARRQQAQARAGLATALGLPVRALAQARLSFAGFDRFPTALTAPEVRRQAILDRADVRSALADYAATQAALQLEIARQYPDVHLGPGYELDQTDNKWTLGVSFTLPILNQNQGRIAEARGARQLAAARFRSVQATAIGQIDSALVGYQAARKQAATAAALLKNLRQRLGSVQEMEQAGEVDPLAVANARVEFNAGAIARLGALVQAQQALGLLEDAVQSPLVLPNAVLRNAQDNPHYSQSQPDHEP